MLRDRPEQTRLNRHSACEESRATGRDVPKRDSSVGFRFAMLNSARPEATADDGGIADVRPACVALVPVVSTVHWSRVPDWQLSRADFIAQLIATAEYAPQTRSLRRATPADAQSAYRANQQRFRRPGIRTRQVI
jgi:hypothetical protein